MIRTTTVAALACAVAVSTASPAAAAVTIGQVAPSGTLPASCPGADFLQPSVTAGANLYVAKAAGTITSWSTMASGPGAEYTLKVFRRTADPDAFRVVALEPPRTLGAGLNTFPASAPVSSGDLLGFHEDGALSACTFDAPGDSVLVRPGHLGAGESGTFAPEPDSRLNLSAVLVPTNTFSFTNLFRDRSTGTATLEIQVSNPGSVTLTGKGLKTRRATKNIAVARTVKFGIATVGKRKKKLNRRGSVSVKLAATFTPTGGDPATQILNVRLKKKR